MPDISMCEGGACPLKEKCYRFTAKPFGLCQSYFMNPPYKDGKCDYFWSNDNFKVRATRKIPPSDTVE